MLYLIRHGESIANSKGIYQGQTYDTSLSDLGKQQGLSTVAFLENKELELVITSPLKRTSETADIIAEELDLDIELNENLMEINHGRWEGKSPQDFITQDKELLKKYKTSPESVFMPGGEHTLDVLKRVDEFLQEYEPLDMPSAIVTHDLVIRMFIVRAIGLPVHNIWKFRLDNCGITTIDLKSRQLLTLNETSHLLGIQADPTKQAL